MGHRWHDTPEGEAADRAAVASEPGAGDKAGVEGEDSDPVRQTAREGVYEGDDGELARRVRGAADDRTVRLLRAARRSQRRRLAQTGAGTMPMLCVKSPKCVALVVVTIRAGGLKCPCSSSIST
jgi:hypothetical protein